MRILKKLEVTTSLDVFLVEILVSEGQALLGEYSGSSPPHRMPQRVEAVVRDASTLDLQVSELESECMNRITAMAGPIIGTRLIACT